MTRSKKVLLIAAFSSVMAWLAGLIVVGNAYEYWYTASGTVNMTDPMAIEHALKDPTFNVSLSWGEFSLVGKLWAFYLPIGFAMAAFVLVIVVGHLTARR